MTVMKNHDKRDDHPTHARRLRKGERLVNWELPPRPAWITKVEYAQMPQSVEIRLVVSAGVQSDATEDASEWCGRRS